MVTAALTVAVTVAFAPYQPGGLGPGFAPPASAEEKSAAGLTKEGLEATAKTAGLETSPEKTSLPVFIGNIIYGALSLTGIIFVLLMIYGGYTWMQARGNTEEIQKAKKIIEGAIIGIVLIALAFAITNFVIDRITEAQRGENLGQTSAR